MFDLIAFSFLLQQRKDENESETLSEVHLPKM